MHISLVYALSPQEACDFFDLTFDQDFHIRRYILRKISNDIEKNYLPQHRQLINALLKKINKKKFIKKQSCAYSIDFLYDSLPANEKRRIFKKFLFSKSSRNRDRALKRIKDNWNKKYQSVVEQVWYIYKDHYALEIILKYFPVGFLKTNYKDLLQHSQPHQKSKLFIKLGETDFNAEHNITKSNGKLETRLSGDDIQELDAKVKPNDSKIDVLIFKEAIALGWDCPRASLLFLQREWKQDRYVFNIQTLGRIMRMPEQKHYDEKPELNIGYVYSASDNFEIVQELADNYANSQQMERERKKTLTHFQNHITEKNP